MTLKEIAVHQGSDARAPDRLEVAIALAKDHGARLSGVFSEDDRRASPHGDGAAGARGAFEAALDSAGVPHEWREVETDARTAVSAAARFADLTVVGQPDPEQDTLSPDFPADVTLTAGGPVLAVPCAGRFERVGQRVMIAWNGSREAARAVRDALPLLVRAEEVVVHSILPKSGAAAGAAELETWLGRHDVRARFSQVVPGDEADAVSGSLSAVGGFGFQQRGPLTADRHAAMPRPDVGPALLSSLAESGADLLVMGVYGHSRLRELLFGGVTREVLRSMTTPVLMSA
ncbi:MAG: universal stress protein [Pseudomonadota bacterium]